MTFVEARVTQGVCDERSVPCDGVASFPSITAYTIFGTVPHDEPIAFGHREAHLECLAGTALEVLLDENLIPKLVSVVSLLDDKSILFGTIGIGDDFKAKQSLSFWARRSSGWGSSWRICFRTSASADATSLIGRLAKVLIIITISLAVRALAIPLTIVGWSVTVIPEKTQMKRVT